MDKRAISLLQELLDLKRYPVGALPFTKRGHEAMDIHAEKMGKIYERLQAFGIMDAKVKRGQVNIRMIEK